MGNEALRAAAGAVLAGRIVAVKGLGRFQLLADATSAEAVALLRRRKRHPHRPFALMLRSLDEVRRRCEVSEEEARALCSHQAPILLLRRRLAAGGSDDDVYEDVTPAVAPGNPYLGVLLPYTPLHHLLLAAIVRPIVCTGCVTPIEIIDEAVAIASRPEVIFCSFGDMLRVPGSKKDLLTIKSEGGDVRVVYSPMDAIALARKYPDRQVVFFAIGFETTAPANAMAVTLAAKLDLENFSVLASHVLVPPAMRAVLDSPLNRVQGFLAAGHVCTITGMDEYRLLAEQYRVPIVITGFE